MWVGCIQNVLFLWSSSLIGLLKKFKTKAYLVIWRSTIFYCLQNSRSMFLLMGKWFSSLSKFVSVIKLHQYKASISSSPLNLPFITLYSSWCSSFLAFLLGVGLTMVLILCLCFCVMPCAFIIVFLSSYWALHLLWYLFVFLLSCWALFIIVFLSSFKALC